MYKINAEEANRKARENSKSDIVLEGIYKQIKTESEKGNFHLITKIGYAYKNTAMRELQNQGFQVERKLRNGYDENEIKIEW